MVEHNKYLNVIFSDASSLMDELAEKTSEFTNLQFIKEAARRSEGAYIDFLCAVQHERGEKEVFNIVHQAIGKRLIAEAQQAGFKQGEKEVGKEISIFGKPTDRIIYRR